ncbi:MAG TPA: phenylalanine--tRNA ligase subunit beta [Pyrinomonadaceae bacterium]|nr:phenylalanine--tRNA ligase subunit beta [Pyrinomonadaceae bacterium]
MNISYNWLKELIDIELSPEETARELTRVGLAVEGVHEHKDDFVLDIDLTSNRPDCLSHLGVARELSASTGKTVFVDRRSLDRLPDAPFPSLLAADVVKIEDANLCYRFTARIIRGVKIGPSPQWLVDRLEAMGERSINNVADITNYAMLELGQPMHAFDMDKLAGNRIVVRRARSGEKITTLDEAEREIDDSMLMICDAEKPVAVGGVMGGLNSSITDATTNVLLEVAYFDRANIRQTSRKLGLATEASYRFERGVDIENLKRASDRATQLIIELAGGQAGEFIDVYPNRQEVKEVESADISVATKRLSSLDVPIEECVRILSALGITPRLESDGSSVSSTTFTIPTWRHDIAIEEDLVEEVARHAGYENIAEELPPAFGAGEYQPSELRKKSFRQGLSDVGFDEAIGYSFIDTKHDGVVQEVPELLNGSIEQPFVELQDSVIEGAVRMRPTLIPGLLDAVRHNMNFQRKDLKLFEIGKVFAADGERGLPKERELFAIALTGGVLNENRSMPVRELDLFDAKGSLELALDAVGIGDVRFDAADVKHLRRGQSATISVGEKQIGYLGRLNEEIAANYKFKQPVFVAEIDLQSVLEREPAPVRYRPLPKFPAIVRDVSFVVDRTMAYQSIKQGALDSGVELLRSVDFVDVFEGKGLGDDQRSLTLRFTYRSDERTLIEDEVTNAHEKVLEHLASNLGVRQRS